jgi:DNA-directed RNA polymerase III subunit RPC2
MFEFVDIEEENTALIAMTVDKITPFTTHTEIHPSTIFSVVTNNIPLANHNFAPRNCFFGSQSKQAIGVYTTNFMLH